MTNVRGIDWNRKVTLGEIYGHYDERFRELEARENALKNSLERLKSQKDELQQYESGISRLEDDMKKTVAEMESVNAEIANRLEKWKESAILETMVNEVVQDEVFKIEDKYGKFIEKKNKDVHDFILAQFRDARGEVRRYIDGEVFRVLLVMLGFLNYLDGKPATDGKPISLQDVRMTLQNLIKTYGPLNLEENSGRIEYGRQFQ